MRLTVVPTRTTPTRQSVTRHTELPRWAGPLVADLALASRAEPFSRAGWIFELKYDGFRLLAAKDGPSVTLRYRSGRDATASFPGIAAAVAALPATTALLDGELVAFGSDGRSDFDRLRSIALTRRRSSGSGRPAATACVFDLLSLDGYDLRQLPLVDRKAHLRALVRDEPRLMYVDHVDGEGERLLAGARQLRLEGVVAKKATSPYVAGRSGAWLKFKIEETSDFVVIGIAEPSEGTFWRSGLVLAASTDDGLRPVGRVGVGAPELALLESVVPLLRRTTPPCAGAGRAAVWLEPGVVCEVRFLASSGRGLRHAIFVRFRLDKRWRECRM